MKTCTVSEAKSKLGELADSVIAGRPTVIVRGGKLVIMQAYALPDHADELVGILVQLAAARKKRFGLPSVE